MIEKIEVTGKTAHLFQDIVGTINSKYVFTLNGGSMPVGEEIVEYGNAFVTERETFRYWIEFAAFCLVCTRAGETHLGYLLGRVLEAELTQLSHAMQVFPDKQAELTQRIQAVQEFVQAALATAAPHQESLSASFKKIIDFDK